MTAPSTSFDATAFFGQTAGPMMLFAAINSAYGAYAGVRNMKTQLKLQESMSRINARLSELSAKQSLINGERAVQAVRMRGNKLKSSQKAAYAASGVDLSSDVVQSVLTGTDYMTEVDALTAESNAIKEAWGYRTQGANYQADALMANANRAGANAGGAAVTSLLTSAAYAAPQLYQMNKAGVTG